MTAKQKSTIAEVETPDQDLGVIVATPADFTVEEIPCTVKRLRAREVLKIVNLIIRGMGDRISQVRLSSDEDVLESQFMAMIMVSLPEMTDEFLDFVDDLVVPRVASEGEAVRKHMRNPDLGVLIDVFQVIITQEKADLPALVGKGRAAMTQIMGLYQTPRSNG